MRFFRENKRIFFFQAWAGNWPRLLHFPVLQKQTKASRLLSKSGIKKKLIDMFLLGEKFQLEINL